MGGRKGESADFGSPDLRRERGKGWLGHPVVPFYPFLRVGSPTKIDCRTKGTFILSSLLEDLGGPSTQLDVRESVLMLLCQWQYYQSPLHRNMALAGVEETSLAHDDFALPC